MNFGTYEGYEGEEPISPEARDHRYLRLGHFLGGIGAYCMTTAGFEMIDGNEDAAASWGAMAVLALGVGMRIVRESNSSLEERAQIPPDDAGLE